MKVFRG